MTLQQGLGKRPPDCQAASEWLYGFALSRERLILDTTGDCGFSPFSDGTFTGRETALARSERLEARCWLRKQLEMNDEA